MTTPSELAKLIGADPPTPEQSSIICADLEHPHLVVAGAGSGKTATMANRVLYLVANGLVEPGQVLGLTFTRKAAGELSERVNRFLNAYDAASGVSQDDALVADRPEMSTYNAFAASVYRDHALRIGYEPDALVITDSVAWRLAHQVVVNSDDERLAFMNNALSTVVDAVLSLAREIADHGVDPDQVAAFAETFREQTAAHIDSIPQKTKREPLAKALASVDSLPLLVSLTKQYQAAKQARGFIEFSDQVALAHRIIVEFPEIAQSYRDRYRAVLLDEYQDTSVSQTRFLAELFGGAGVMAVGDPDQSIYGFRGASAANLSRFHTDFGAGTTFQLTVSWRNSYAVLAAANDVSNMLERTAGIAKEPLRAHPNTAPGWVTTTFDTDIVAEANRVAEWFAERIERERSDGSKSSGGLLLRSKSRFTVFADALRARDIPVHILGLSGLLSEPVVVDVVAALAVLHDPSANAELLRLLTGARWRIAPADIRQLHQLAGTIAAHDERGVPLSAEARRAKRNSLEEIDTSSLVDALDAIARAAIPDAAWLDGFSEEGLHRMRAAGSQLAALRRRSTLQLSDLVDLVVAELQLDVEARANADSATAVNALEAFHDLVGDFSQVSTSSSLAEFLSWLDDVERKEALAPRQELAEDGAVQIMTVHAAKGLEWDYVALPRMVKDEFPIKPHNGSTSGWLQLGSLPYPFRGDRNELPRFNVEGVTSGEELLDEYSSFKLAVAEHQRQEEWRLGYVAVTRPRNELLITGSHWAGHKNPRVSSEIADCVTEMLPADAKAHWVAEPGNRPDLTGTQTTWPLDPLGDRADIVRQARDAVVAARPEQLADSAELHLLITKLLRERDAQRSRAELPVRVPASRVKDLLVDSADVLAQLYRPLPQQPFAATRLGTLFHSWVERRALDSIEIDAFDDERESDELVSNDQLDVLKATFERSVWGALKPVEVEREIHLPMADHIFICKIDAVYDAAAHPELGCAPGVRFQVVDWKTGAAPKDQADLERKQSQLTLYRLAYAKHLGIDPEQVDAVFYYVADDHVVRPTQLLSEDEFIAEWRAALG